MNRIDVKEGWMEGREGKGEEGEGRREGKEKKIYTTSRPIITAWNMQSKRSRAFSCPTVTRAVYCITHLRCVPLLTFVKLQRFLFVVIFRRALRNAYKTLHGEQRVPRCGPMLIQRWCGFRMIIRGMPMSSRFRAWIKTRKNGIGFFFRSISYRANLIIDEREWDGRRKRNKEEGGESEREMDTEKSEKKR